MKARGRVTFAAFVGLGLAAAALLVVLLAPRASREPDGLNKVAIDEGFADTESRHALDDTPTAGYTIDGSDSAPGTVAAGLIGVAVTFGVTGGVFLLVRHRSPSGAPS
jgi:cobalt/nickel transport system permease protein